MTDKEIIEFWGHIVELAESCDPTAKIPLSDGSAEATYRLIKRLKRENKIYKNKAKVLTEKLEALGDPLQDAHYKIAEQQVEIEVLKKIQQKILSKQGDYTTNNATVCEDCENLWVDALLKDKSEAIKEFAERYEKIKTDRLICSFCCFKDGVDDLVKEIVGDAE